jgi:catechol 2,3-dioxygenase-like lactoylglutathione lyase family enzyme
MEKMISGIQQVGIGIPHVYDAWKWYRKYFSMNVPIFDEAAEAGLMLPYTGGVPQKRHAVLAINMKGGGGFEIWQYTERTPEAASEKILLGDLGIFACRVKSTDVQATYDYFQSEGLHLAGQVETLPNGQKHFFVLDPYGNVFEVVENKEWFGTGKDLTGGAAGCIIGVSNIENARRLYTDILGYDTVIYDQTGEFEDLKPLPGGKNVFRRVLLSHSKPRQGGFSKLFGPSEIELIQVLDRVPKKIFENRFWGDLGFIHLCFDVVGMEHLEKECEEKGFPFTVNSRKSLNGKFDMGEAAGHFSYIEDPDGTLIEFVETLKIPIIKKIGWYLDLKKRDDTKPLPNWMVKSLGFGKVKD